ncbi:MAG: hypothetical protein M3Z17_12155, partial [Gemmatimonadota bacterium]|nr:hypothetical protein [Gemmatimonadota bacterium]
MKKLAASGHEIWFCDATFSPRPQDWLPQGIKEFVPSAPLPRDAGPESVEKGIAEVRRMLEDVKPDVVHAGPVQTAGYGIALAGFHPMLLMSWGSDILLSDERDVKWKEATRLALEGADGLFVDSTTVLEKANGRAMLPDDRIVQLPWGVELARYERTTAEQDEA